MAEKSSQEPLAQKAVAEIEELRTKAKKWLQELQFEPGEGFLTSRSFFGTVYPARSQHSDLVVAVKFSRSFGPDAQAQEQATLNLLSNQTHPNIVLVTRKQFWPGSWIAVSLGFRLLCASSHRNRCCLQKPFVRGPIFVGWLLQWQRRPWRFSRQHCCVLKPQVGEIRSRIGGGKPLFDGVQAGLGSWSTCWFPTHTFQAQLPESFQASPANR